MKNLDLKKTGRLIRLLIVEQKMRFHLSPIVGTFVLVLFSWLMNTQDLESGIEISVSPLVALILIIPYVTFLSSFLQGKTGVFKQLIPVSSCEKYLSIWGAGLTVSAIWLAVIPLLTGLFWILVGHFAFGREFSEVWTIYTDSYQLALFSVSFVILAAYSLWTLSARQKDASRYRIPAIILCGCIIYIVALIVLANAAGPEHLPTVEYLMLLVAVLIFFGAATWGHFLFKKIQFINK